MAEGGYFPWKIQKVFSKGPAASYSNLREPLPKPPTGMEWSQDKETKEWKLTKLITEPDLQEEKFSKMVDLPEGKLMKNDENEWELLSDKASAASAAASAIFITRAGSVRSINSVDNEHSSHTTLSVPYKIQRTASSSTIDSQDGALGPSGKGVLGVDYVEHVILPTDTLQGICIAYKVSASSLRRANHFTGHSLQLAPKKLLIPMSKQALRAGFIRVQDTDSKEYKLHAFQAEFPDVSLTEAKAYLELADWELKEAIQSAKEDKEWEKEVQGEDSLKAGEISIKVDVYEGKPVGIKMKGIGMISKDSKIDPPVKEESKETQKETVVVHDKPPAIATKSMQPQDYFDAAPQHDGFGVELQSLPKPTNTDP